MAKSSGSLCNAYLEVDGDVDATNCDRKECVFASAPAFLGPLQRERSAAVLPPLAAPEAPGLPEPAACSVDPAVASAHR